MSPAARRQLLRARIRGTDRALLSRLAKMLGVSSRRPAPPPRRVAARAIVLSAVVCRAYLEMNLKDMPPNPGSHSALTFLPASTAWD